MLTDILPTKEVNINLQEPSDHSSEVSQDRSDILSAIPVRPSVSLDLMQHNDNYTTAEPAPSSSADSVMSDFMSKAGDSVTCATSSGDAFDLEISVSAKTAPDQQQTSTLEHLLSVSTLRPTSLLPSLSLLYPDTAPRSAWRPQIDTWMKKNHPTKLREIVELCSCEDRKSAGPNTAQDDPRRIGASSSTNSSSSSSSGVLSASPKREGRLSLDNKPYARNHKQSTDHPRQTHKLQHTNEHRPNHAATANPGTSHSVHSHPHASSHLVPNLSHLSEVSDSHSKLPSPPSSPLQDNNTGGTFSRRRCISCGSDQSPCWRPSWSATAGQLCNSCGLRYKKTGARCISSSCRRIPAKGEWMVMKNAAQRVNGKLMYQCLGCGGEVEVGER